MINEGELTGERRGDFTELRILQNGEFVDILPLLATGESGVNNIVSGGGLAVSIDNGTATILNDAPIVKSFEDKCLPILEVIGSV